MNFLHYAIVMFIVCAAILVGVSVATPAPSRRKLAGLTFATVDDKIETTRVGLPVHKPAPESPLQHRLNVTLSTVLVLTVVSLWIYFR
jgi:SSS family solute:Na+ symporter